jgi:hypothetical protein
VNVACAVLVVPLLPSGFVLYPLAIAIAANHGPRTPLGKETG